MASAPGAVHPLGALIQRHIEVNRGSYATIADRATRHGHPMVRQTVGEIATRPVRSISAERIESLAFGLQLPAEIVAKAALASMGFTDYSVEDWRAEGAVRNDPTLSSRDREVVLGILRQMRQAAPESPAVQDTRRDPLTLLERHAAKDVDERVDVPGRDPEHSP